MENASALIADAHVLLNADSFGRARSLAVLAQEEPGKALLVYDTFESSWSTGENEPCRVDSLAKHADIAEQRGFYVDRTKNGVITSPTEVQQGSIADDLQVAAQVVEMLLIRDHSRMKMEAVAKYDSTHAQQSRLLPISHPEDWAAASESFRRGGDAQGEPGTGS